MTIENPFKFIGQIPDGYNYRFFRCDEGILKIVGIAIGKPPIAYIVGEDQIVRIDNSLKIYGQ